MSNLEKNNNAEAGKKDLFGKITLIIISAIIILSFVSLGISIFDRNNKIKASVLFEKAYDKILELDKAPNIYTKQEMEKEILDDLNKVIVKYQFTSSSKRALFYKGHVLFNTGNFEKAEKVFQLFINKNRSNYLSDKAYYYLAYCYSENGKLDDAVKTLENFVKKYKNSYYQPIALYRLGNLYEMKNDKEKAINNYKALVDKYPNASQKASARIRISLLNNDMKL